MKKYLFVFTLFYIAFEIIYNLGLVEFLSSKNTEMSVYSNLETLGKTLASVGFALVLLRLFKKYKVVSFIIMVPILFMTQTVLFEKIIDNLSPTAKVAGYLSGVYRNAVLNGNIEDSRFSDVDNLSAYNKVVLSNVWVLNQGQVKERVNAFLNQKIETDVIQGFYKNYSEVSNKLEPYYATYAIYSKRYDGSNKFVKSFVDKEFKEKTGGLPQGLNKEQFYQEVTKVSPSYKAYSEAVIIEKNEGLGIQEFRAGDIPFGLSEAQFSALLQSKFSEVINKMSISESNVEGLPHSRELITSVFIPPIAITLSLLSIVLNASILLFQVNRILFFVPIIITILVYVSYPNNPYRIYGYTNKAIGVEASFFKLMTPVVKVIHTVAIDDNKPNEEEIIRIKKPEAINFQDLENKMSSLKSASLSEPMPVLEERISADSERLEKEKGYFGEIKTTKNPYLK